MIAAKAAALVIIALALLVIMLALTACLTATPTPENEWEERLVGWQIHDVSPTPTPTPTPEPTATPRPTATPAPWKEYRLQAIRKYHTEGARCKREQNAKGYSYFDERYYCWQDALSDLRIRWNAHSRIPETDPDSDLFEQRLCNEALWLWEWGDSLAYTPYQMAEGGPYSGRVRFNRTVADLAKSGLKGGCGIDKSPPRPEDKRTSDFRTRKWCLTYLAGPLVLWYPDHVAGVVCEVLP